MLGLRIAVGYGTIFSTSICRGLAASGCGYFEWNAGLVKVKIWRYMWEVGCPLHFGHWIPVVHVYYACSCKRSDHLAWMIVLWCGVFLCLYFLGNCGNNWDLETKIISTKHSARFCLIQKELRSSCKSPVCKYLFWSFWFWFVTWENCYIRRPFERTFLLLREDFNREYFIFFFIFNGLFFSFDGVVLFENKWVQVEEGGRGVFGSALPVFWFQLTDWFNWPVGCAKKKIVLLKIRQKNWHLWDLNPCAEAQVQSCLPTIPQRHCWTWAWSRPLMINSMMFPGKRLYTLKGWLQTPSHPTRDILVFLRFLTLCQAGKERIRCGRCSNKYIIYLEASLNCLPGRQGVDLGWWVSVYINILAHGSELFARPARSSWGWWVSKYSNCMHNVPRYLNSLPGWQGDDPGWQVPA